MKPTLVTTAPEIPSAVVKAFDPKVKRCREDLDPLIDALALKGHRLPVIIAAFLQEAIGAAVYLHSTGSLNATIIDAMVARVIKETKAVRKRPRAGTAFR